MEVFVLAGVIVVLGFLALAAMRFGIDSRGWETEVFKR